jgi:16S rRNA (guanine527-N7)-methyltransferase
MTQQKYLPKPSIILLEGSKALGIQLTEEAIFNMLRYIDLLKSWNSKFNLTSINESQKIAVAHFLDSLTIFMVWRDHANVSLLDIGTGAGFPGLVLKIVDESIGLTLLDKNPKRIVFLKLVANELNISGVSFINLPVQDFIQKPVHYLYDTVSFRAMPKKVMRFLDLDKVLSNSGSLIRMYSGLADIDKTELRGFREIERWTGCLPYFEFERTVIRYQRNDND